MQLAIALPVLAGSLGTVRLVCFVDLQQASNSLIAKMESNQVFVQNSFAAVVAAVADTFVNA